MADTNSNGVEAPKGNGSKKRSKKALIAWIVAGALVLGGGGVATAIGVSSYNAETVSLCVAATDAAAQARTAANTAQQAAADALTAVENTVLPDSTGTSALFAERPAVEEIPAQKAEGDQPEVKAVPARPSGQEFIDEVKQAQSALTKAEKQLAETCETRDDAQGITAQAEEVQKSAKALQSATEELSDEFAVFQADEAARIAAEAAAAEAARIAAEQAAAEAADAAQYSGYDDYSAGGDSGWSGGGSGSSGGFSGCPAGWTDMGGGCMMIPPSDPNAPPCPPGTVVAIGVDGRPIVCG